MCKRVQTRKISFPRQSRREFQKTKECNYFICIVSSLKSFPLTRSTAREESIAELELGLKCWVSFGLNPKNQLPARVRPVVKDSAISQKHKHIGQFTLIDIAAHCYFKARIKFELVFHDSALPITLLQSYLVQFFSLYRLIVLRL